MARSLADQIELALERGSLDARTRRDEQLLDLRHRGTRAVADVGLVRARRHEPPAEELLALFGADAGNGRLAALALGRVGRQEHVAGRERTRRRQLDAELALEDLGEELARQRRQDPGAVAGVRLGAARAAVIHPAEQVIRVGEDLVAPLALDVRDEADAAAVVLELGPVEASGRRQAVARVVTHIRRPYAVAKNGPTVGRTSPPTVETGFPQLQS